MGQETNLTKRSELGDIIDRFEEAWRHGVRPDINQFLTGSAGEASTLAIELIHIDLEYRLKDRDAARVEDYLARYPWLADNSQLMLELLTSEFRHRRRYEPELSIEDYLQRFPQWREALLDRLGTHQSTLSPALTPLEGTPHLCTTLNTGKGDGVAAQQVADAPVSPLPGGAASAVRYTVVRPHAKGGLGQVSVARDAKLRRQVALKEIRPDRRSAEARRRFLAEAEITGQLEHPGIVPIYTLEEDAEGEPYYAMRFIQGRPMSDAIQACHREPTVMAFRDLLQRFVSVCQTMAYAHSQGVIHRDLKPSNVMLGDYGETLVVDWGLAKRVVSGQWPVVGKEKPAIDDAPPLAVDSTALPEINPVPSEATQTGAALGTPGYMAPEQAAGKWNCVGPCSDIYSLGATLYELLTGARPIRAQNVSEALQKALAGEFLAPREMKADVPKPLEAICLKAMALKPEGRYATAKDLAGDLEHWLADESVSAYHEPWIVTSGRWLRRHRAIAASAAATLVIGIVALSGIAVLLEKSRRDLQAEQSKTQQAYDKETIARKQTRDSLAKLTDRFVQEAIGRKKQISESDREFLSGVLKDYEAFAATHGDSPAARELQAEGLYRVGQLRHNLGDLRGAREAYEHAGALQQGLVDEFPATPLYRRQLARSHNNLGNVLQDLGDRMAARAMLERAIATFRQMAAGASDSAEDRESLARSLTSLGYFLFRQRDRTAARAAFDEAVAIKSQLVSDFPKAEKYRQELATSYNNLGVLLVDEADWPAARAAYEHALAIRKQLAADSPSNGEYRQDLAISQQNLGIFLADRQEWAAARAAYEEATSIQRRLADEFPSIAQYRQDLARTCNNLAVLLVHQGDRPAARAAYEQSVTLRRQLVTESPFVATYRHDLAVSLTNLAALLHDSRDLPAARASFEEALALQKQLAADVPNAPEYRQELARIHLNLGNLLAGMGDSAAAISAFEQAVALQKRLLEEHPDVAGYQLALAASCGNLGAMVRDGGRLEAALDWYAQGMSLLQKVLAQNPRSALARQFLRNAHLGRAKTLDRLRRYADAVQDWTHAIDLDDGSGRAGLRRQRAASLARAGEHAQAVNEAEELAKTDDKDSNAIYDLACVYALACAAAKDDAKLKEQYAARAVEMLRQAVAKGFKNIEHLKKDDDLMVLREREDYLKLVKELSP